MTDRRMDEIVRRQNPATLPTYATVQDACRVMRDRRIGAMLVTSDSGSLAGIFTGRDAVGRVLAEARDPAATRLTEVMTRSPETIGPRDKASDALQMMFFGGYRHLPIVDANGKILGIVSRGDFSGSELARRDEETGFWEIV
ncbi:MAG TPA: CBS domain-containing protein [Acidisphaera sp.]|nr:CBS domain-containing protein [Acidisphaera sp.]